MNLTTPTESLKSALFVDFDNIYISLKNIDKDAAEKFATDPARWLGWFERGMPNEETEAAALTTTRKLLLRRCYINPVSFGKYRAYFTRCAFSIIDCPPLTQQGKNSTDIHMVMDILDTLKHETHFDEFIILSGDTDFMPVLLRLRLYNRLTVILTAGPVAQPYKAASDRVISGDDFIEDGLGIGAEEPIKKGEAAVIAPTKVQEEVLDEISQRLYEQVIQGDLLAINIPPILKEFVEFRNSNNWLGFMSLRELAAELTRRKPEMHIVEGDPSWRLSLRPIQSQHPAPVLVIEPTLDRNNHDDLTKQIMAIVNQLVAGSIQPVNMGHAGNEVIKTLGSTVLETGWAGAGSFTAFLRSVKNLDYEVVTIPGQPGYLFDPKRHKQPELPPQTESASTLDRLQKVSPEIADLARRVSNVTGTPLLTPGEYALAFQVIEDELKEHPFFLGATSKAVRDRCIERGSPIPRKAVNFILQGIFYGGHRFGENPANDNVQVISRVFTKNVLTLCKDAQLELTGDERELLDQWLLAGATTSDQPHLAELKSLQ